MVNRDYRKEVGLAGAKKNVPKPVAIAVLLGVAIAISLSATHVAGEAAKRHASKAAPPAAAAPAASAVPAAD